MKKLKLLSVNCFVLERFVLIDQQYSNAKNQLSKVLYITGVPAQQSPVHYRRAQKVLPDNKHFELWKHILNLKYALFLSII